MIKKFTDFTVKENATAYWEDALYNASKKYFYGEDEPSIFNQMIDEAFGPEFKGERPSKEDIKIKILEWVNDALDNYVFSETETKDLEQDQEKEEE